MACMRWKKSEPMEQRIEFALKAMRTLKSTFKRVLERAGLTQKRRRRRPTEERGACAAGGELRRRTKYGQWILKGGGEMLGDAASL
jgi:hypothetical protein